MTVERRRRILVVDDDPQVAKLYGLILTKQGYEVTAANSGAAAEKILDEDGADLVVLDLEMPKPDGFDLLKIFRIRKPELPILVVSGYLNGALLEASALAGAMASMSKTEAPSVMPHVVRLLLA
jgi:two-component system, NtrC family, response regulator GlrR